MLLVTHTRQIEEPPSILGRYTNAIVIKLISLIWKLPPQVSSQMHIINLHIKFHQSTYETTHFYHIRQSMTERENNHKSNATSVTGELLTLFFD